MVDSREVATHKAVLVARSPVFKAMLGHSNTAESASNSMTIDDCKYAPFCIFLKYLYTGNLFDTVLYDRFVYITTLERPNAYLIKFGSDCHKIVQSYPVKMYKQKREGWLVIILSARLFFLDSYFNISEELH